jgi:hypothetical protein
MKGTIDSITKKTSKDGKEFHIIVIDRIDYSYWDSAEGLSQGQQVEFDFIPSGKWKNITEIKVIADSSHLPQQRSGYDDSKVWNTCCMCAKDIVVAQIQAEGGKFKLSEIKSAVIDMALAFYRASEEKQDLHQLEEEEKPIESNDTSFPTSSFADLKHMMEETDWKKKVEVNTLLVDYEEAIQGYTPGQQRIIIALADKIMNGLED